MSKTRFAISLILFLFISSILIAGDFEELVRKGNSLYQEKKYEESAEAYEDAFDVGTPGPGHYYNAACSWALAGKKSAAFRNLKRAIDAGWRDLKWLQADPDLESLRGDDRWERLTAKVRKNLDKLIGDLPEVHEELAVVKLPAPRLDGETSVEEALQGRRSIRTYSSEPLTLEEVSQLLWSAYGITKKMEKPAFLRGGFRTAPSAGGLYPLELYLVAGNVKGLPDGIYWYKSETHELAKIARGDKRDKLCEAGLSQEMIKTAPAAIVYSAVFERNTRKYGPRGRERYVWMDAGHSAENLYLQAYALGLGMCVSGAFDDLLVRSVVGMTKEEEPIYIIPVGNKEEKE